ncbi:MAG TPA: hypothetical protein VFW90_00405 [Candidatus Saccharimonadales bacterium]|nr:hypothetical protein [Candidatus Saccharimonadales bacterium]
MREQLASDPPQEVKNLELLRNSELGQVLSRVYIEAMNLDPRLAEVEIIRLDDESPSLAQARPSWATETGRHQVHLQLNNLEKALAKTKQSLDTVPGAREIFASKLGIEPEMMTPQMLYVFGVAHELGHITEYMDYEADPEALKERRKKERAALPIGNTTVSALMKVDSNARKYVEENWDDISKAFHITSFEELLNLQHSAYRSMSGERHADNFAESVFVGQPAIIDQMAAPSLEPYRHLPLVA